MRLVQMFLKPAPTLLLMKVHSSGDVVVVNINFRLNVFGSPALNNGVQVVTGNYALADKIAALEWVQENIAIFGGDPKRVTVVGQSTERRS
ncbi:hypothetical protein D9758_005059 [Tetrapyrgos nigripes]|uniref:Carboxylesterase type B domain-containing protein n=1 Tax=Tetrapyrgos nigripes TaxID=182062 RepID=A0A8H5LWI1_9AGAR|nr:hypothetical protein D9758_005059 [Tetrapyrgos nigripes]